MKYMQWDDDAGGFVEREEPDFEEVELADWEKELLEKAREDSPVEIILRNDKDEVVAQASGNTFEEAQAIIKRILEAQEPRAKKIQYDMIAGLLRALMHKKLANSNWSGMSKKWREDYLANLEKGKEIYRRNASFIT